MLEGAGSGGTGQAARTIGAPITLAHESPFRIGEAEFSPATREVTFKDKRSIVEPRVMQVLVALHQADGAVVSKDDLAILCWEGRIVGEDAINRVVSRVRSVAEKQAGRQFRIETITKVGYRLVPAAGSPGSHIQTGETRRAVLIGGTAIGAAAAAGVGWALARRDRMPVEARLLVEEARKSLYEGGFDAPDNAVGTLRRATQLAPDSAEAWGLLAFAYIVAASAAPSQEGIALHARAVSAMNHAFALQPYQPDALAAQLQTIPKYGNWYAYEQACRAALRHHPRDPVLRAYLASLMLSVGRNREALPIIESVLPRMPRSAPVLNAHIYALWNLGLLEQADEAVARAFQILPRSEDIWSTRLFYLMFNDREPDAAAMLADESGRPLGLNEGDIERFKVQVNALSTRDRAQIREAVEMGGQAARAGRGFVVTAAIFAGFVGALDEAFALLNALYFNRGFTLPGSYFSSPRSPYVGHERITNFLFSRPMAGVRSDRRFAALIREIGLEDYWARTGTRSHISL